MKRRFSKKNIALSLLSLYSAGMTIATVQKSIENDALLDITKKINPDLSYLSFQYNIIQFFTDLSIFIAIVLILSILLARSERK